jgi:hypothetical protein
MARIYNVIDADGHVLEPVDIWEKYIDPAYRDRAPRLIIDTDGKERLLVEGQVLGSKKGFGNIGARHRHRAYVYAGMDPCTRDRDGRPHWSALFVAGSLAEDLAWRIEPALALRQRPLEDAASEPPRTSLYPLARAIGVSFEISVENLRSVRRGGPAAARARGAFVHAARALSNCGLRDVAAWMRYASPAAAAAAAERFDRTVQADPGMARRLREVLESVTSGSRSARPERST